jgi:hypothetical protein
MESWMDRPPSGEERQDQERLLVGVGELLESLGAPS